MAKIRITRTLVIEGPEEWVRMTCGTKTFVSADRPFIPREGHSIVETSRVEEMLPEPEQSNG